MSEIDGRKPEIAVIATDYAEKSKNSSKNKPQRISMYRDPNKDVGILLDDNHNKTRVDLRKSLRTARNSNESDVASPKSTHQTPPRERPARPSFEGKLTNTPCDGVRSARSSFESDSRRSEGTRRSTVASAFVNSIHGCCVLLIPIIAVPMASMHCLLPGMNHTSTILICVYYPLTHFILLFISWEGHLHVVNYLLSKGSNVNVVVPSTKYSPTHAAATDGYVEVLKVLLDAGWILLQ